MNNDQFPEQLNAHSQESNEGPIYFRLRRQASKTERCGMGELEVQRKSSRSHSHNHEH
jgi:hypothetical protein